MQNGQYKRHQESPRPKRGWPKYVAGAVLTYGVCVVLGGRMFSNDFATIIEHGLIIGLFLFVLLGPAHLLLQVLARRSMSLLWSPRKQIEAVVLNLPIVAILALLLMGAAIPPSPAVLRESLKRHFSGQLPDSVSVKGYRMSRGLNEGSYIFVFSINASDLGSLLTKTGFVLANSGPATNRLSWYTEQANKLAKGSVSIDMPCATYVSETNRGLCRTRKTLVVGSNSVDVVFCESFH